MPTIPPTIKKIFSIAIFAGIVFFGAKTCSVESAECELVFQLKPEASIDMMALEIRLYEEGDSDLIGEFKKRYYRQNTDVPARWPIKVAAGEYRIEGEMHRKDDVVSFTKAVTLTDGDTIVVHLDRYLKPDSSE